MKLGSFAAGIVVGTLLFGGGTAVAAGLLAEPSAHPVYVDGEEVSMEAYIIQGSSYVKLRDVGQALDFNVYWEDGIQVDSTMPYTGQPPARTADLSSMRQELVERTNALRRESGVDVLENSALLNQAAQVRAEEMAAATVYSHTRPDGSAANTVTDSPYTGENIHRVSLELLEHTGQTVAESVMETWSSSAVHRSNVLDSRYGSFGVGLARGVNDSGQACWYCVQLFLLDGYTVTWVDDPVTK